MLQEAVHVDVGQQWTCDALLGHTARTGRPLSRGMTKATTLPEIGMRSSNDCGFLYRRKFVDHGLDCGRVNIVATADDRIFSPRDRSQKSGERDTAESNYRDTCAGPDPTRIHRGPHAGHNGATK